MSPPGSARQRQTERAVERFWRPILVSACNEEPERISCTHAFKIFRDGFLAHPTAFQFGVPRSRSACSTPNRPWPI